MKLKNLKKKIRRLETRLKEGPKKLAKLKQKLEAAEAGRAMKGKGKSPAQTTGATKPGTAKKAKRKLNLSPERRAQLSAAMKARWAARRAAEGNAKPTSSDNQPSPPGSPSQMPENRPDGA
jgi:predicted RNase H-like nuclease (RuvC/YqgF family)